MTVMKIEGSMPFMWITLISAFRDLQLNYPLRAEGEVMVQQRALTKYMTGIRKLACNWRSAVRA